MRHRLLALAAASTAVVLAPWSAVAATAAEEAPSPGDAVGAAATWLEAQQQPDGGFDRVLPGAETPDAVLALAEAAQTEAAWSTRAAVERVESVRTRRGQTPLDAVEGWADTEAPGAVARMVTRVALPLGLDPGEEGPLGDLLGRVADALARGDEVAFADRIELGLAALAGGGTLPEGFVDEVLGAQAANGGWNAEGDPDAEAVDLGTTAAVVDLLVVAGVDPGSEAVRAAVALAAGTQQASGGWIAADGTPDVEATAGAVRLLRAAGEDPASNCWRTELGVGGTEGSAVSYLVAQQAEDGSFGDRHPVFTTSEVVHALSGRWLPLGRVAPTCGTETSGLPFEPSLLVLAAIAVFGVGGGIRILHRSDQGV